MVAAGQFQLWHDRSGPVVQLRQAEVPGCRLFATGCCTTPEPELPGIASRLARDDMAALAAVDGSRVVIAVRSDDVLVAGDLAGQCPVFFTHVGGEVVVSSHARPLAEHTGRLLDRDWLATRLLVPAASDVWWTGSPWRGVHAVRPGWLLGIDSAGQAETRRWLNVAAPRAGLVDGGAALRSGLQQAVAARVAAADRPTVDLSGGLDSSTVAVLAAHVADEPIRALTLTVDGVDDAAVAAQVASSVPGIEHERVEIPDAVLPYSDLDRLPAVDEPADYLVVGAWVQWWRRLVAEWGSDVHLGGDGGDGVLLALPSYLADLADPLSAVRLWRHAGGWARLRHQAPYTLVRAAAGLWRTSYRDALTQAADRLANDRPGPSGWSRLVSWFEVSGAAAWVTPDAREVVADRLRQHAAEQGKPVVPGRFGVGDASAWLSLNAFARSLRADVALAEDCGITVQSPYLDDGVVRACWSVPASVRTSPEQAKPLLRQAVGGLVPASVVERRTKGDYTALSYRGLNRNADALDDILASSRLSELGLLDAEQVRAELRRGAAGLPIRLGAFDTVLGVELWLRSVETSQPPMLTGVGGGHALPA